MATTADTTAVGATVLKQLSAFVRKLAFDIQARLVLAMQGARSGRIYKKRSRSAGISAKGRKKARGRGRLHQASAPGEAPAVDSGALRVAVSRAPRIISATQAEINITPLYAEFLERGTTRMAARPFIRPAIQGAIKAAGKGGVIQTLRITGLD